MPSTTKSTMMTCLMAAAHQSRRVFFGRWQVFRYIRCGNWRSILQAIPSTARYRVRGIAGVCHSNCGNLDDGVTKKELMKSERAWNITKRLSPHPSIPTTMHFVKQTANPFNDGRLHFEHVLLANGDRLRSIGAADCSRRPRCRLTSPSELVHRSSIATYMAC